ncbi:hypothetical protein O181_008973 [Austropuccinia psidii MF-1]|uniref:Uncharacterized protein n=1 Tax=Austropuccinia psidii MF-1 TaxID=1389203 RepID=A0A9Q3BQG4_9BASI|nr:hypothetical protein [Austropuccinia psidii MF-1]
MNNHSSNHHPLITTYNTDTENKKLKKMKWVVNQRRIDQEKLKTDLKERFERNLPVQDPQHPNGSGKRKIQQSRQMNKIKQKLQQAVA